MDTLFKMVDGETVPMSEAEAADIRKTWAETETAPTPEERIAELKQFLRDTDYVALPDYDQAKPEVLAQRQAWRDEIRGLEA
jgi:hypothetical protein